MPQNATQKSPQRIHSLPAALTPIQIKCRTNSSPQPKPLGGGRKKADKKGEH